MEPPIGLPSRIFSSGRKIRDVSIISDGCISELEGHVENRTPRMLERQRMNFLNDGLIRCARYRISTSNTRLPLTILAWEIDPSWKIENRFAIHSVPSMFIGVKLVVIPSGRNLLIFVEPASADPHARWCAEGARQRVGLPDLVGSLSILFGRRKGASDLINHCIKAIKVLFFKISRRERKCGVRQWQ